MGWLPWRRKKVHSGPTEVVMYTRRDCHLCTEAYSLLEELRDRFALTLKAVDVDQQADLQRLYGERVPVIVIDGKERFWGRINRVLLERMLKAKGSTRI